MIFIESAITANYTTDTMFVFIKGTLKLLLTVHNDAAFLVKEGDRHIFKYVRKISVVKVPSYVIGARAVHGWGRY